MRVRNNVLPVGRYFCTYNGQITIDTGWQNQTVEYFYESAYPGSNNCRHYRWRGFEKPTLWQDNPGGIRCYASGITENIVDVDFLAAINFARPSLNWDKLPTSSKFGLIQLLAELDESILIFGRKFWRSLTYGSFTWGVLPFVSEINQILKSVVRLATDTDGKHPYEDSIILDASGQATALGKQNWELIGTARLSGSVKFDITDVRSLLDFVGFQPSLSTAWDLIPLSFLVDYLIPVGSVLDRFSNKGWVTSLYFEGWQTLKYTVRYGCSRKEHGMNPNYHVDNTGFNHVKTYFERNFIKEQVVVDQQDGPAVFEFPSFTELFNLLYVFVLQKRTGL